MNKHDLYSDENFIVRQVSEKKICVIYKVKIGVHVDGNFHLLEVVKNRTIYSISDRGVYINTGKGNGYFSRKISHKYGIKLNSIHLTQDREFQIGKYTLNWLNTHYILTGDRAKVILRDLKLKEIIE